MVLFFIYTHDLIQEAVKMETSLLAERRKETTEDGKEKSRFMELVMDEEYDVLFRRLFLQAHADLMTKIPGKYLAETPTDLRPVFREFPDFHSDRDFCLWLNMQESFVKNYRKSVDVLIEQFLIDYICWRWFETKLPKEAMTYFERMENTKIKILDMLGKRSGDLRRLPSFP